LNITPEQLCEVAEREGRELVRRKASYRGGRPPADVTGKTVILVDDGLATGGGMLAAVQEPPEREPGQIVIAIPAAPEFTWMWRNTIVRDFAD
jgi:predicted phosphoribosyltransferase